MASQLSFQRFMEFGYFGIHFSVTRSKAAMAFFSSAAWYIVFKSVANAFLLLYLEHISRYLTLDERYIFDIVLGNAAAIALIPVSPSAQMIRISFTPRFFNSFKTESQYLELSFSPIRIVSTSLYLPH